MQRSFSVLLVGSNLQRHAWPFSWMAVKTSSTFSLRKWRLATDTLVWPVNDHKFMLRRFAFATTKTLWPLWMSQTRATWTSSPRRVTWDICTRTRYICWTLLQTKVPFLRHQSTETRSSEIIAQKTKFRCLLFQGWLTEDQSVVLLDDELDEYYGSGDDEWANSDFISLWPKMSESVPWGHLAYLSSCREQTAPTWSKKCSVPGTQGHTFGTWLTSRPQPWWTPTSAVKSPSTTTSTYWETWPTRATTTWVLVSLLCGWEYKLFFFLLFSSSCIATCRPTKTNGVHAKQNCKAGS